MNKRHKANGQKDQNNDDNHESVEAVGFFVGEVAKVYTLCR